MEHILCVYSEILDTSVQFAVKILQLHKSTAKLCTPIFQVFESHTANGLLVTVPLTRCVFLTKNDKFKKTKNGAISQKSATFLKKKLPHIFCHFKTRNVLQKS